MNWKKTTTSSMFSDAEFETMQSAWMNQRDLGDAEYASERIREFEAQIGKLFAEKPPEYQIAIRLLVEARNFLARFHKQSEIAMPNFDKIEDPSQVSQKHIAIFVIGGLDKPLGRALKQTLASPPLRYQIYGDQSLLTNHMLEGLLCGIVGVSFGGSIDASIRHGLKNLPGWDYDASERYTLPPCFDYTPRHTLLDLCRVLSQFQDGTYRENLGAFSLTAALPTLVAHMRIPSQSVTVMVVDDVKEEAAGMLEILKAWQNVHVKTLMQINLETPTICDGNDIILLDESMRGNVTGTQMAEELLAKGFKGVFASTTSGQKPAFTEHHFGAKRNVNKNWDAAKEFVLFMNPLLAAWD